MRVILAIFIAAAMLASCDNGGGSKKNKDDGEGSKVESMDKDGNCTQDYVDAYNRVSYAKKSMKWELSFSVSEDEQLKAIKSADESCRAFFRDHGGVACTAEVDDASYTISSSDMKEFCDSIDSRLKELGGAPKEDSNQGGGNTGNTGDARELSAAANPKMTILSKSSFEKLANSREGIIFSGKVYSSSALVPSSDALEMLDGFCMVSSFTDVSGVPENFYSVNGVSMKVYSELISEDGSTRVITVSMEDQVIMSCGRSTRLDQKFTIGEINKIFGGVAKVTSN